MSEKLGTATLELVADGTKLGKDLDSWEREAGGSAKRGGAKFSEGVSKATLPAMAALGAVIVGGKKAADAASDLGEQVSKNTVVFKGSEQGILAWSKTTGKALGISQRAALEATGTFGNMLVPMGIARKDAAGMSKTMVTLAADMASFNNASPEETLDALRAGLAGEAEPLRKFGVFLNEDRVALEAISSGLVKAEVDMTKVKQAQFAMADATTKAKQALKEHGRTSREYQEALVDVDIAESKVSKALAGKVPKLTAAQKATATYQLVMKDTSDTQGDFARTSESVANQERIQAATAEDLQAKIGKGLLPVMAMYQKTVAAITGFLADHTTATKVVAGVIAGLAGGVLAINAGLKVYRAMTVAATAAQWLFNAALTANPIGVIVIALAALGVALVVAYKKSETFRDIVHRALDIVKGAFDAVKSGAQAVANFLEGPLSVAVGAAKIYIAAWKLAIEAVVTVIGKLADGIRWIIDKGVGLIGAARDKLAGPLATIRDAFGDVADKVKAIYTWVGKVIDRVETLIGWIGKIHIPKIDIPLIGGSEIRKRSVPAGGSADLLGALSSLADEAAIGRAFGLGVSSGYRPGDPGDHGRRKAIDMSGPWAGMISFALAMFGRPGSKDVIFGGLPVWQDNGRMIATWAGNEGLRADHLDHVHVSEFDIGGWLEPGVTLAINNTGKREAVVPMDESGALSDQRPIIIQHVDASDMTQVRLMVAKVMRELAVA